MVGALVTIAVVVVPTAVSTLVVLVVITATKHAHKATEAASTALVLVLVVVVVTSAAEQATEATSTRIVLLVVSSTREHQSNLITNHVFNATAAGMTTHSTTNGRSKKGTVTTFSALVLAALASRSTLVVALVIVVRSLALLARVVEVVG